MGRIGNGYVMGDSRSGSASQIYCGEPDLRPALANELAVCGSELKPCWLRVDQAGRQRMGTDRAVESRDSPIPTKRAPIKCFDRSSYTGLHNFAGWWLTLWGKSLQNRHTRCYRHTTAHGLFCARCADLDASATQAFPGANAHRSVGANRGSGRQEARRGIGMELHCRRARGPCTVLLGYCVPWLLGALNPGPATSDVAGPYRPLLRKGC